MGFEDIKKDIEHAQEEKKQSDLTARKKAEEYSNTRHKNKTELLTRAESVFKNYLGSSQKGAGDYEIEIKNNKINDNTSIKIYKYDSGKPVYIGEIGVSFGHIEINQKDILVRDANIDNAVLYVYDLNIKPPSQRVSPLDDDEKFIFRDATLSISNIEILISTEFLDKYLKDLMAKSI